MTDSSIIASRARTKIVATVGPACREVDQLTELIRSGVSVFRINTAHGDEAERTLAEILRDEPSLAGWIWVESVDLIAGGLN